MADEKPTHSRVETAFALIFLGPVVGITLSAPALGTTLILLALLDSALLGVPGLWYLQ